MFSERNDEQKEVLDNICDLLKDSEKMKTITDISKIIGNPLERSYNKKIEQLDENKFDSFFPLVSLVIITANTIECDAFNFVSSKYSESCKIYKRKMPLSIFPGKDLGAPESYIIIQDKTTLLHLHATETGSNTPGGSADIVRFVSKIKYLCPVAIVSCGICYGRDPVNQKIGDVIIPLKLYPWSIAQKINENTEKFYIKTDKYNFSLEDHFSEYNIYSKIRDFTNNSRGIHVNHKISTNDEENAMIINLEYDVLSGNMSTGEAVVSSATLKNNISEATNIQTELGGEMEAYGIAKECIYYSSIPCILIKAICDWGIYKDIDRVLAEGKNMAWTTLVGLENMHLDDYCLKDMLQSYAAFNACNTLMLLINSYRDIFLKCRLIKEMEMSKKDRVLMMEKNNHLTEMEIRNCICYAYESMGVNDVNCATIKTTLFKFGLFKKCENNDRRGNCLYKLVTNSKGVYIDE